VRNLPVRVKLLIRSRFSRKEVIVPALVNTGFTTETPDLALPLRVAEELGLWPQPKEALRVSLETGGGSVDTYIVPQAVIVKVITKDRESREVKANTLINPYIGEVLMSDALTEELGIQILYPRRGLWRFRDEEIIRESES